MALLKDEQRMHWYVMRDLKRPNAKLPAYKQLSDEHLDRKSTRLNSSHNRESRMPSSA